jgi:hypothetical protein
MVTLYDGGLTIVLSDGSSVTAHPSAAPPMATMDAIIRSRRTGQPERCLSGPVALLLMVVRFDGGLTIRLSDESGVTTKRRAADGKTGGNY